MFTYSCIRFHEVLKGQTSNLINLFADAVKHPADYENLTVFGKNGDALFILKGTDIFKVTENGLVKVA